MATPRSAQIDLDATQYYHCMTRCVRGSFLCGLDYETGRDYSHRKPLIVSRIKQLASIFAIKISAYAVMSNHYHLVQYVDSQQASSWTDEEVRARWAMLFPRDAKNVMLDIDARMLEQKIAMWRNRLMNISWFMRCLNEYIARLANREDVLKGRFWEGRFKSQALLDEGAVLSAMVYTDLNPIRAGIALTPETSEFSSIYDRIQFISKQPKKLEFTTENINKTKQPKQLMSFGLIKSEDKIAGIDIKLSDYLNLVDYTGRILRADKIGAIPTQLLPIIARLNLKPQGWIDIVKGGLEKMFCYTVGHITQLVNFKPNDRLRAPKGSHGAKQCYLEDAA